MIDNMKPAACGFALVLCLVGCGRRDGLMEVNGTVVYDGQPVQMGTITFLPADGKGPTAAGVVGDGKYALRVAPGPKLVRIEGFKVTSRRHYFPNDPQSPMVDIREQILPERYNAKSELTCELTSTADTYNFTLRKSSTDP